jgi:hypothetical protein
MQVLNFFGDDVAPCKYHVWWPGSGDPFYQHNTAPVHTRISSFYGINGVPDVCVDGWNGPSPHNYSEQVTAINNRLAIPSDLVIDVEGVIIGGDDNGTCEVSVDLTVETPQPAGTYRLFVALIEDHIDYAAPNGETEHHYTFRWFNNNGSNPGEVIDLSAAGTQQFDYTYTFFSSVYQIDQMSITAWVQNMSTRNVLQGGRTHLLVPYYVLAHHTNASSQIGAPGDAVHFEGQIENGGANDDTYDLTLSGVPAGWTCTYTTPAGTYSGPSTLSLLSGELADVSLDLDSQGMPGPGVVTLDIVSQGNPQNTASLTCTKINGMDVLLVDDDQGEDREVPIQASLDAAGVTYATFIRDEGPLTADNLTNAAEAVLWSCGSSADYPQPPVTLDAGDRDAIGAYLDAGGRVCLTGADIAHDLGYESSSNYAGTWLDDYFGVDYINFSSFRWNIVGVPGDPIGDGYTNLALLSSGDYTQLTPDGVAPIENGIVSFDYYNSDRDAVIRTESGGAKTVFFSFGLEGLSSSSARDEIVDRVIEWFGGATGIADPQTAAPLVRLAQNVPNPFRPSTSISYELGAAGPVSLRIYDVSGRLIRTLVDDEQGAATHSVNWNGTDDAGRTVASGVYFYQLEAPGVTETRRMVLEH